MEEKYSKQIYLLPNFPMKNETLLSQPPMFHDELTSIYAEI